jgi:predicted Zn-dependent protease
VRLRRPTEVARAYEAMTRRWPDDAIAWYGLGAARDALGDTLGREQAITRMASLVQDRNKRLELVRYRAEFPEMWPAPPARVDTLLARR